MLKINSITPFRLLPDWGEQGKSVRELGKNVNNQKASFQVFHFKI